MIRTLHLPRGGSTPWPTARLLTLITSIALTLLVLQAQPAPAAERLAVELQMPQVTSDVSGSVFVAFVVPEVGGPVLAEAQVSIGSASQSQLIDTESCASRCPLSTTLDVSRLVDGPTLLSITLTMTDGRHQTTDFALAVHNAPNVYPSYLGLGEGLLTADDTLRIRAAVEPHNGATVATVTWRDDRGEVDFRLDPDPSDISGADWAAVVDTSGRPEGGHRGVIVATDTSGRTSAPVEVSFEVVRGVTLTTRNAPSGTVYDTAFQVLDIDYAYAPAVRSARPVRATLKVDGQAQGYPMKPELLGVSPSDNAGTARVSPEHRIPAGLHTVAVTLEDNRGLTQTVSYRVTVRATVTAAWVSGSAATIVANTRHVMVAKVTTAGGATLAGCSLEVKQSQGFPYTTCLKQRDGSWRVQSEVMLYFSGPTPIRLRLIPEMGLPVYLDTVLTVVPKATVRILPAGGPVAGKRAELVGQLFSTGRTPAGVGVDLQTRASAKKSWTTVATGTSGPDGLVRIPIVLPRSADFRMVTKSRRGVWGGAEGPATFVKVTATVTVTSVPTSISSGRSFTVKVATKPGDRGVFLGLQQWVPAYGEWVNSGGALTDKDGRAVITRPPGITAAYRVARTTDAKTYGTVSRSFTIAVKK